MTETPPMYPLHPYELIGNALVNSHSSGANEVGYAFNTLVAISRARKQGIAHPSEMFLKNLLTMTADDYSKEVAHRALKKAKLGALCDFYDNAVGGLPPTMLGE